MILGASGGRQLALAIGIVLVLLLMLLILFLAADAALFIGVSCAYVLLLTTAFFAKRNSDYFDPYYIVPIVFGLYSLSSAASIVFGSQAFDPDVMRRFYVCMMLGAVAFIVGNLWAGSRRALPSATALQQARANRLFAVALVVTTLGLLMWDPQGLTEAFRTSNVLAYTETATNARLTSRDSSFGGVEAFLRGLPQFFLVMSCLLLALSARRVLTRAVAGVLLSYVLLLSVMGGGKALLLTVLFGILVWVHYRQRRVRIGWVLAIALITYPFAVMISHVRYTTSVTEMWTDAVRLIQEDPRILLPNNAGELNGPPQTLMLLIESIRDGELSLSYGRTYVDEALTWVPRAVYPSRPRPLSEQFMEIFYPVADAEGRGEGFYILTAGYWAFGYLGVWLEMFAYGVVVAFVYRWFLARLSDDAAVLLYGPALFTLAIAGTRTGLIGTLKGLTMFIVPFALLAVAVAFASRQKPGRKSPAILSAVTASHRDSR